MIKIKKTPLDKVTIMLILFLILGILSSYWMLTTEQVVINDKIVDNNKILSEHIRKDCKDVTVDDLMKLSIIENKDEIKNVSFFNAISKGFRIKSCLVTNEYISSYSKSGLKNKDLELIELIKNEKDYLYKFNSKCEKISKSTLIDNFIIRTNEDNRELEYINMYPLNSKDRIHRTSDCYIYKKIN